MAFSIDFSTEAGEHLRVLRKRDQQIIIRAIREQLTHEPDQITKQRKPLPGAWLAPWELRVGEFRVFYKFDSTDQIVVIVAIGRKVHDRLTIGGVEIDL